MTGWNLPDGCTDGDVNTGWNCGKGRRKISDMGPYKVALWGVGGWVVSGFPSSKAKAIRTAEIWVKHGTSAKVIDQDDNKVWECAA